MRLSESEYQYLLARSGQKVPQDMQEKRFMSQVVRLARELGYVAYHTYRSTRSPAGFPDLVLARPEDKLVLAELKSARGKLTQEQHNWYEHLRRIERVETYVWHPQDMPGIVETLRRQEGR